MERDPKASVEQPSKRGRTRTIDDPALPGRNQRPGHARFRFQQGRRRQESGRLFLPLRLSAVDYLVCFTDGAQERYSVAYTAGIEAEQSRHGWHYRGHVSRQLSIYNRAGERFDKADADRRLELMSGDDHNTATNWHECALTDSADLAEKELSQVLQRIKTAIMVSVMADKRRLESNFRHAFKGVEAVSEID